jgi:hypothetical protein
MSDLPLGWGNRNNEMSEHDMKLGGVAATKFANKNSSASAYEGDSSGVYKSSDDVRAFYLQQQQLKEQQKQPENKESDLPAFWQERQKIREVEGKQFASSQPPPSEDASNKPASSSSSDHGPEVALVQVTTHTLEALATTLEHNLSLKIPMTERAALAQAMKRAMDALANSA